MDNATRHLNKPQKLLEIVFVYDHLTSYCHTMLLILKIFQKLVDFVYYRERKTILKTIILIVLSMGINTVALKLYYSKLD